jgi:hypothetical protein
LAAVAFDWARIDCSRISSMGMNTNEDNTIRSKNLLLKNAENKNKLLRYIIFVKERLSSKAIGAYFKLSILLTL